MPRVGIQGQQKTYPVTVLCKVMSVSTSAYYDWAKQPEDTDKILENQKLRERAQAIFDASKRSYGSRRLSDGLKKAGFPVGRYKTRRVVSELNLRPRYPKRFKVATGSNHNDAIVPNLLGRLLMWRSRTTYGRRILVPRVGITYVWTLEGRLYVPSGA